MLKPTSLAIVAAAAIGATAACGTNNTRNTSSTSSTSTAQKAPAADQQHEKAPTPITLTGCLQQDGRTYIVTRLNEPSQKGVGTTGNGAAVEREQLREAANAYRLDAKEQADWDKMVGKQVRVSGSVDKPADLPTPSASGADARDKTTATAGATDTDRREKDTNAREKIDKGDLAQIAVASMTVVSDNCGGKTKSSSVAKKAASGKTRR